jgi:ribonuclease D
MKISQKIERALNAAKRPTLLETASELDAAGETWAGKAQLGLDTEFLRERTYRAKLGLIQVSDGESVWLIDPISIGGLDPLTQLMKSRDTLKIIHSGSEDLEILQNELAALPEPLFDTQIACALLGQPLQMGYHHAVKWLLDVEVEKDQTRSNWMRRPLSERQLRYAALDVLLLPLMHEILHQRLKKAGRLAWLEEEVDRVKRVSTEAVKPEEAYLRFKRVGGFDDASMRVLQALAKWREIKAVEKDLARGFVVSDQAVLKLAKLKPGSLNELKREGFVDKRTMARYGQELVDEIARAKSASNPVPRLEELTANQKRQLNRMRQQVNEVSNELGIDPALLASRRELEKLVRALAEDLPPPERFMGWRLGVVTQTLLET